MYICISPRLATNEKRAILNCISIRQDIRLELTGEKQYLRIA